jgi:DinB superfamily
MIDMSKSRLITQMGKTATILQGMVHGVTAQEARKATDGPDGWAVIEIVCHLRDFDGYFQQRCHLMLNEENPALPAFDHEAIAIDQKYIEQDLQTALAAYLDSRRRFIALVEGLSDEQLARPGVHPESGPITVLEQSFRSILHDIDHTEQIARTLGKATRF